MAFDAGDIFSTYLQGASFVANSLDRAENRRRQQEQDELRGLAGKGLEIFAPKYDKDGKLIPRTSGDIFNDPQTLELANHPYMKAARMQGITDPTVKDVRYVGGTPLEDGQRVVPIVEQLDEDGNIISRGPLTEGRSRDGKAAVTPITVDTMFNHLAGEVYRRDPEIGASLMQKARDQALAGLQTQYRNAATPQEQEELVRIGESYGYSPESLMAHSGAPVTRQNLALGVKEIHGADGSLRYELDPKTRGLANAIDDHEFGRKLKQQRITQDQTAKVANANANRFAGEENQREINRYSTVEPAKAATDRGVNNTNAESAADAERLLVSENPDDQRMGRTLLGGIYGDKAPAIIQSKLSKKSLSDAMSSNGLFPGKTPEEVGQITAENFHSMSSDDQNAAMAKLMPGLRAGNPNAMAAYDAMLGKPMGGKGESPKPAEFNSGAGKDFIKANKGSDELAKSFPINGGVQFNETRDILAKHGVFVEKGSVDDAKLQRVVATSALISERGQLSDAGIERTAPALWTWENLPDDLKVRWGHSENDGVPAAESFVRDVYKPLGDARKAAGLPVDIASMNENTRDVVELQRAGLSAEKAIALSMKTAKMPADQRTALGFQIKQYARDNNKTPWEVAADWYERGITSKQQAEQRNREKTVRGLGRTGSALYPEPY